MAAGLAVPQIDTCHYNISRVRACKDSSRKVHFLSKLSIEKRKHILCTLHKGAHATST